MSIGLAIIALNEEQNLPKLLGSISGAFDRVVLLDTGSTDNTIRVFEQWAAAETADLSWQHGTFSWVNDFAAARAAADRLLLGDGPTPLVDWTCWADCDDTIEGAQALRGLAEQADSQVQALAFLYDYVQHPATGQSICQLTRERLVRAGRGVWQGRVHEGQTFPHPGPVQMVPPQVAHWKHHKLSADPDAATITSNSRNLAILRQWAKDEPHNPRVVGYLAKELGIGEGPAAAVEVFEQYAKIPDLRWDDERAQCHRIWATQLIALERPGDAELVALAAVQHRPTWPDSYLTLAECNAIRGDWEAVRHWTEQVETRGTPHTVLIVNPLDYTALPKRMRAVALANENRLEDAITVAEASLELNPIDDELRALWGQWRAAKKRDSTADTYVMMAEQLIAHDEQLKALTLLTDCVPHFATDHAKVVSMRSFLRERLAWIWDDVGMADHYEHGGSKPEDFHDDETSDAIAGQLPRVEYLLDGLREQAAPHAG